MGVPLIDLAEGTPAQQALRIDEALRSAGFFAITGHGVPAPVVAAAFDAGHRFFALGEEAKTRWHINQWPLKRGFDPIGWQSLDPGNPPDVKESFYLGVEAIGPNQWPDEALVPGFRAACNTYSAAMEALARRMMGLFEQALALPAGHFDSFMRHPTCTTRLLPSAAMCSASDRSVPSRRRASYRQTAPSVTGKRPQVQVLKSVSSARVPKLASK